jgi:hypothetical protein
MPGCGLCLEQYFDISFEIHYRHSTIAQFYCEPFPRTMAQDKPLIERAKADFGGYFGGYKSV